MITATNKKNDGLVQNFTARPQKSLLTDESTEKLSKKIQKKQKMKYLCHSDILLYKGNSTAKTLRSDGSSINTFA